MLIFIKTGLMPETRCADIGGRTSGQYKGNQIAEGQRMKRAQPARSTRLSQGLSNAMDVALELG